MKMKDSKAYHYFIDYLFVIFGTALMALTMDVFVAPNQIVPGGVNGIAMIINYLTGFPIGTCAFLINIPLLMIGFFFLGKKFLLKTLVSTFLFSIFADFVFAGMPIYTHDTLLATIFAGAFMGIGLGMIYIRGGSSGGTDITSRLLQKRHPYLKMGAINLVTNSIIILVAVFVFNNLEAALYAVVIIFIQAQIIDKFLYGLDVGKMIMIVTSKEDSVCEAIMVGMKHGCTIIPAKGAYSGGKTAIVLCAIRKNEFYRLKKIVYTIDKHAFVIVTDAGEVVGKGFASESMVPKELQ